MLTFQVQDRVHNMLKHARTGNRAFFGYMPDDKDGQPCRFGNFAQLAGAFAHLGYRACGGLHVGQSHGLNRVNDEHRRFLLGDMLHDRTKVGFRYQKQIFG